jgi:diguanylate cyclase (GGDEF)-like protein
MALSKKKVRVAPLALAREKLEGRLVGGKFSQLANYSDLFDRSHDGILLVDVRNHEVLETNAAFRDFAESDRSFEGSSFPDLFGEEVAKRIKAWLGGDASAGISLEVSTAFGKILELTFAKVRLADYCETFQVIARDVSAERSKRDALERQSLTDEMTGLSNFRSFQSRLALEDERARKKGQTYSVLFVDVDHFKHYNDRNGHPAGDVALRKVASVLRGLAGRTEFVARYGGEEFVVLCSNAGVAQASEFAEKARAAIAAESFPHGEAQPLGRVSVSIGVSEFDPSLTAKAILARADEALYRAKHAGRNCVVADLPQAVISKKRA